MTLFKGFKAGLQFLFMVFVCSGDILKKYDFPGLLVTLHLARGFGSLFHVVTKILRRQLHKFLKNFSRISIVTIIMSRRNPLNDFVINF